MSRGRGRGEPSRRRRFARKREAAMAGEAAPGAHRRGSPLSPMEGERGEVGVGGPAPGFTGDPRARPRSRGAAPPPGPARGARAQHPPRAPSLCLRLPGTAFPWLLRLSGRTLPAGLRLGLPAQGPGFPAPGTGVQPLLAAKTCPVCLGCSLEGVQAWPYGDRADHSPPSEPASWAGGGVEIAGTVWPGGLSHTLGSLWFLLLLAAGPDLLGTGPGVGAEPHPVPPLA